MSDDDQRPMPSTADQVTLAHCAGYREGISGRRYARPSYASATLATAWARGWWLGVKRIGTPSGEGLAPSSEPESDAAPAAVPSSSAGGR